MFFVSEKYLPILFALLVSGCGPTWSRADTFGGVNFCGAAMTYDLLVVASSTGPASAAEFALDFSPDPRWYSTIPASVKRWEWGESPADISIVTPADATKGEVRGVPITDRDFFVFLRTSTSSRRELRFFAGLGDLGSLESDGAIAFPGVRYSEEEFLRRANTARQNPDCAFMPDLMVRSN